MGKTPKPKKIVKPKKSKIEKKEISDQWMNESAPKHAFLSQKMPGVIRLNTALSSSGLSTMKRLLYWELLTSRSIIEGRGIEFTEAMNAISRFKTNTRNLKLTDKQIGDLIRKAHGNIEFKKELLKKFNCI